MVIWKTCVKLSNNYGGGDIVDDDQDMLYNVVCIRTVTRGPPVAANIHSRTNTTSEHF